MYYIDRWSSILSLQSTLLIDLLLSYSILLLSGKKQLPKINSKFSKTAYSIFTYRALILRFRHSRFGARTQTRNIPTKGRMNNATFSIPRISLNNRDLTSCARKNWKEENRERISFPLSRLIYGWNQIENSDISIRSFFFFFFFFFFF